MTQQYLDLREIVGVSKEKDAKAYKRYMIIQSMIGLLMSITMLVAIYSIKGDNMSMAWSYIGITWMILIFQLLYHKIYHTNILCRLTICCRPDDYLSIYMAMTCFRKSKDKWETMFYNVAMGLLYQGRLDEMEKVIALYPKYCQTGKGEFFYNILIMRLAYEQKNLQLFMRHSAILEGVKARVKMDSPTRKLYDVIVSFQNHLRLECQGDYQTLYEELTKTVDNKNNLAEVIHNYRCYKVAVRLDLLNEAEHYKTVVLSKGGTTCYKEELSHFI